MEESRQTVEGMGFEGSLSLSTGGRSRVEREAACGVLLRTHKNCEKRCEVAFFQDMECFLSSVPSGEKYLLLGDFNVRVGSREYVRDQWGSERGPHGYRATNNAAKELLSFLSIHQATVCNTWYKKMAIYINRHGNIQSLSSGAV